MSNDPSALIAALAAVAILVLICRWVFKPSRPRTGRPVDAAQSVELGLLRVLATELSRDDALQLRARLGDYDIRSSVSRRRNGTVDVLVFTDDLDRARIALGPG